MKRERGRQNRSRSEDGYSFKACRKRISAETILRQQLLGSSSEKPTLGLHSLHRLLHRRTRHARPLFRSIAPIADSFGNSSNNRLVMDASGNSKRINLGKAKRRHRCGESSETTHACVMSRLLCSVHVCTAADFKYLYMHLSLYARMHVYMSMHKRGYACKQNSAQAYMQEGYHLEKKEVTITSKRKHVKEMGYRHYLSYRPTSEPWVSLS